ncbi:MAG: DUF2760 domain-containing protein [Polyangiaceae bacterium]|nr:DUF2760 domain-containing protein [Polyangiaceae bacterium]
MVRDVVTEALPLGTRIWFAIACFFKVLFDGAFAARAYAVRRALPPAPRPASEVEVGPPSHREPSEPPGEGASHPASTRSRSAAAPGAELDAKPLQLLSLLQREGRFIDFVQQDVAGFDDADLGAAARVVHEGCRRALRGHADIEPLRSEAEDSTVEVLPGYDPSECKLTGRVAGRPPFRGTLRHRGWRARRLALPETLPGHNATVLAPAEIEL